MGERRGNASLDGWCCWAVFLNGGNTGGFMLGVEFFEGAKNQKSAWAVCASLVADNEMVALEI